MPAGHGLGLANHGVSFVRIGQGSAPNPTELAWPVESNLLGFEVYMKKLAASSISRNSPFPNPNHSAGNHFHSNPNFNRFRPQDDDYELAATDDDAASFTPRSRFESDYVTFELGGFSRMELGELKRRLVSELEQVRIVRTRIESCSASTAPSLVHRRPSQFLATDVAAESPRFKGTPLPPKGKKVSSGTKRSFHAPNGNKDESNLKMFREHNLPPAVASMSMLKRCGQILTKLMKHKDSWVFNKPVDASALGLHDYHQIIKNPMDLGTVKKKLDKNVYSLPGDFAADVLLTFNNALMYNPKGHDVHAMAEVLLSMFEQMYEPAYRNYEKETEKLIVGGRDDVKSIVWEEDLVSGKREPNAVQKTKKPCPRPKMNPIPNPELNPGPELSNRDGFLVTEQGASVKSQVRGGVKREKLGTLRKPKAKDPNKREMSFEEKAKLGMNLQNLPQEKMGQLLHIIRKRNKQFVQDGDEIELDIEAVSTDTLWELDRFVCNYKKLSTKIKRSQKGLIHNQVSTSNIINTPLENVVSEAATTQHEKKREAGGDEDVDIGDDDIPMSSYPPVEIERDGAKFNTSSSSSSSRNSSSSSDSDSRSSLGSDSDADSLRSPFVGSKGAQVS